MGFERSLLRLPAWEVIGPPYGAVFSRSNLPARFLVELTIGIFPTDMHGDGPGLTELVLDETPVREHTWVQRDVAIATRVVGL